MGQTHSMYAQFESLLSNFLTGIRTVNGSRAPVRDALLVRNDLGEEVAYDFKTPVANVSPQIETQFIQALSETRAFRRLHDIRFLGSLDYFIITGPNGLPHNSRFSRAQHSLGVAALAQSYLGLVDRSVHERLVCVAAALLHDIGHTPFSHTLESLFQEKFGLDHHRVSAAMIRGEDREFEDIRCVLTEFGVDPDEVIAILSGEDALFDHYFSWPINFDTIEGILRSRQYVKMSSLGLQPNKVVEAATRRANPCDERVVDSFWFAKHEMYNVVIRSAYGAMLDLVFKKIVASYDDILTPNDFYLTDIQAFRKFPALRWALDMRRFDSLREDLLGSSLNVVVRSFFVDHSVEFGLRRDRKRYLQSKEVKNLTLPKLKASLEDWPLGESHGLHHECAELF